jgi:hypothetical protein
LNQKRPQRRASWRPTVCFDRGWGKAAQLVDVQGEIRQLVEVKVNVVQATPAALPGAEPLTIEHDEKA